jgi:hypothetical protein
MGCFLTGYGSNIDLLPKYERPRYREVKIRQSQNIFVFTSFSVSLLINLGGIESASLSATFMDHSRVGMTPGCGSLA